MLAPLESHIRFCEENLKKFDALFGTGCSAFLDEVMTDRRLVEEVMAAVRDVPQFKRKDWDHPRLFGLYRLTMYCLVRHVRPIRMIETGVLHGFSSLLILDAFVRNGTGTLISIDEPSYFETGPANNDGFLDVLPKEMGPGWVVPERHRAFWDLRLGKSSVLLEPALNERRVDIFLHDSEHTYETMTRELELAWTGVVEGGFIVADNIDTNTSFFDFANRKGRQVLVCSGDPSAERYHQSVRFGVLRK
jgi:hypothetical protein